MLSPSSQIKKNIFVYFILKHVMKKLNGVAVEIKMIKSENEMLKG